MSSYPTLGDLRMSSSGKGQSVAKDAEELGRAYDYAVANMRGDRPRVIVEQAGAILTGLDRAVRLATMVAIAMGMVVLAGAVVATRRSRIRDLVLLKLVGASRSQVVGTQLVEFALQSTAVAIVAFAAGIAGASLVTGQVLDIPLQPNWPALVFIPIGAVILAVAAALLAALPALNARPARALRAL